MAKDTDYSLQAEAPTSLEPPQLDYRPGRPRHFQPRIGLIGCGGVASFHLAAYKKAGYQVIALCDLDKEAAVRRRDEFYTNAVVTTDFRQLLARSDINVIDAALHPEPRAAVIREALQAGKHVLSQKPFVTDLAVGEELAGLAERQSLKLAVNQNGRWAPHVRYMYLAIEAGLIGRVQSIDLSVHWNHNWVADTAFNDIPFLLLYDFAIHWFDMVNYYLPGQRARRVNTMLKQFAGQQARPPMGASLQIEFDDALANLSFNGNTRAGPQDRTVIVGSLGTLSSQGPDLGHQRVTLSTADGAGSPVLEGTWFSEGFDGTMSELLCAIEEDRQPGNSARNNLNSLAISFAAMESAESMRPVNVGDATRLENRWLTYAKPSR